MLAKNIMDDNKTPVPPDYDLSLQTVPMPADTNSNGDIFGGWILSQMDIAGAVKAVQTTKKRVTTVGIDAMSFYKPVFVGDIVSFYTKVERIGTTSITIKIESWAKRRIAQNNVKVTEGVFTYVALNEHREPTPIESS